MMIAVLKLLAPTRPTIGKTGIIISIIVRKRFIRCTFLLTRHARKKITATFANSEG